MDLAAALGVPGVQHELDDVEPRHALRLFYLFFQRTAFLPQAWDNAGRTFHAYALNEARIYEEKVSQDLGARVFQDIFPQLADALARRWSTWNNPIFECLGPRRIARRPI